MAAQFNLFCNPSYNTPFKPDANPKKRPFVENSHSFLAPIAKRVSQQGAVALQQPVIDQTALILTVNALFDEASKAFTKGDWTAAARLFGQVISNEMASPEMKVVSRYNRASILHNNEAETKEIFNLCHEVINDPHASPDFVAKAKIIVSSAMMKRPESLNALSKILNELLLENDLPPFVVVAAQFQLSLATYKLFQKIPQLTEPSGIHELHSLCDQIILSSPFAFLRLEAHLAKADIVHRYSSEHQELDEELDPVSAIPADHFSRAH